MFTLQMRKAQIDHWVTPFSATAIWPASCEITFHYLRLIKTTFLRSPQRLSPIRSLHTTRPVMGQTLPANATLELANFLDNSNRNIKLPTTAPSSCITVKEVCDTNVHVMLKNLSVWWSVDLFSFWLKITAAPPSRRISKRYWWCKSFQQRCIWLEPQRRVRQSGSRI